MVTATVNRPRRRQRALVLLRRRDPARPLRTGLTKIVIRPFERATADRYLPRPWVVMLSLGGLAALVVTIALTLSIVNAVIVVAAATLMHVFCPYRTRS